jgi:hypothetical protein
MGRRRNTQRNPYKGEPPRPWIRLHILDPDGDPIPVELLADTGSPYAVIVSPKVMALARQEEGPEFATNFGALEGGWIRIVIPELKFDEELMGFASESVAAATEASCSDFQGLAGLPLLRMLEYGGDADGFWIKR